MRKCVFSTPFIHNEIDPRVQQQWTETYGVGAPFGKLRQMWKAVHCTKVDPYNTGCPYSQEDCGLAFLVAVERTVGARPDRPTGYFRTVALTLGLDRADNKPLARDTLRRTDVLKEGDTEGSRGSSATRRGATPQERLEDQRAGSSSDLHRATSGPVRISELLGAIDPRPHQGPSTDSQEGDQ